MYLYLRLPYFYDVSYYQLTKEKNEFMKILKLKDAGKEAQGLQELLQKKGYNAPQNGIFDEGTKASVIAFQQADG